VNGQLRRYRITGELDVLRRNWTSFGPAHNCERGVSAGCSAGISATCVFVTRGGLVCRLGRLDLSNASSKKAIRYGITQADACRSAAIGGAGSVGNIAATLNSSVNNKMRAAWRASAGPLLT
jgi:hypothetical protein